MLSGRISTGTFLGSFGAMTTRSSTPSPTATALVNLAAGGPGCAPKTPASHRTIPLPDVVVTALREHLAAYPVHHRDRLLCTDNDGRGIRRKRSPGDLAPGSRSGVRTPRHRLSRSTPLLRLAAHPSRRVDQDRAAAARPHHAAETLDTYAHLWPDSDDRTREAVNSALARQSRTSNASTARPASRPRPQPDPAL